VRAYAVVDVFAEAPYAGNPVAVVLDGEGLSTEQMQRFAAWTNLSETTFVLGATVPEADYRVRIFTPVLELPFAGHPTIGTCHAWLRAQAGVGGESQSPSAHRLVRAGAVVDAVVQQCAGGLVRLHVGAERIAFAAPELLREGPVQDESLLAHLAEVLGIERAAILDAEWADNGPGWVAVMLADADVVLALRPGYVDVDLGVIGPYPPGSAAAFEVRAFFPKNGTTVEDPVTGSLNAAIAPWLLRTGRARAPYVVSQGTALGRRGRVHVDRDEQGTVWVGGRAVTCVAGRAEL
jgi:PhzF family phenazine biosynthesis protein